MLLTIITSFYGGFNASEEKTKTYPLREGWEELVRLRKLQFSYDDGTYYRVSFRLSYEIHRADEKMLLGAIKGAEKRQRKQERRQLNEYRLVDSFPDVFNVDEEDILI